MREAESEARSAVLQSRIEELEFTLHSKEEQIVCAGEKICELNTRSEEAAAAQSVQIASVMSALEQERRQSARLRQLESQSASVRRAGSTVMASTSADAQAAEIRARIADLEPELQAKAEAAVGEAKELVRQEREAESEARTALQSRIEELECALHSNEEQIAGAKSDAHKFFCLHVRLNVMLCDFLYYLPDFPSSSYIQCFCLSFCPLLVGKRNCSYRKKDKSYLRKAWREEACSRAFPFPPFSF